MALVQVALTAGRRRLTTFRLLQLMIFYEGDIRVPALPKGDGRSCLATRQRYFEGQGCCDHRALHIRGAQPPLGEVWHVQMLLPNVHHRNLLAAVGHRRLWASQGIFLKH